MDLENTDTFNNNSDFSVKTSISYVSSCPCSQAIITVNNITVKPNGRTAEKPTHSSLVL
jgi:GTP cyclohydrolase FolE2